MARQQDNRRRGGAAASRPANRAAQQAERARCAAVLASVSAGPQVLLFDDFNRPDGPLGTAPTGQAWVDFNSGTALQNQQVVISDDFALADVGVISATVSATIASTGEAYAAVCWSNSDGWANTISLTENTGTYSVLCMYWYYEGGEWAWFRNVTSTGVPVDVTFPCTLSARVAADGRSVQGLINNTVILTQNLVVPEGKPSDSYYTPGTLYGISGGVANSPALIDSITVTVP